MTLVSWGLLFMILAGIAGLFAFGVIGARRTLPFRVLFYVLVAMFLATVVVGVSQRPPLGYNPTPDHPRGTEPSKAPGY